MAERQRRSGGIDFHSVRGEAVGDHAAGESRRELLQRNHRIRVEGHHREGTGIGRKGRGRDLLQAAVPVEAGS